MPKYFAVAANAALAIIFGFAVVNGTSAQPQRHGRGPVEGPEWWPGDSVKVCVGLKPAQQTKIMFVVPKFFTIADCRKLLTGNTQGNAFPSQGYLDYHPYFMCYNTAAHGLMTMGPENGAPQPEQNNSCGW
ncbi:MAG: hypothetical protein JOY71_30000 [Acetobacteraceae bacterium]|nr:hypothetical protein [Acetobacteraceae bacterium]MBV8526296.1 hypothetical protein [Acetobacteraceae bacterium]